jgi:uncharacterized Tic20 family protein
LVKVDFVPGAGATISKVAGGAAEAGLATPNASEAMRGKIAGLARIKGERRGNLPVAAIIKARVAPESTIRVKTKADVPPALLFSCFPVCYSVFPESNPPHGCVQFIDAMETSYPQPPPPAPVNVSAIVNVRTWAAFIHASALLGVVLHFPGHLLGPLILWFIKRDDAPELDAHGKEAVNFQISMLIYNAVAAVFCLVLVGFVFLAILWVLNAIFVIIAAIKASDGEFYRYPMTIRFIQ